MSESEVTIERDSKSGRFLPGNSGNGGRRPGARGKLGEQFLLDLRDAWTELGPEALRRCAKEDPSQFCRIVAGLLPKTIDINQTIGANAESVLASFRQAVTALGNVAPRSLPSAKVINGSS